MCERRIDSEDDYSVAEKSDSVIRSNNENQDISSEYEYDPPSSHNRPKIRRSEKRRPTSQPNQKVATAKSARPASSQKDDDGTIGCRIIGRHQDATSPRNRTGNYREEIRQRCAQAKTSRAGVLSRIENGCFDSPLVNHRTKERSSTENDRRTVRDPNGKSGSPRKSNTSRKKDDRRSDAPDKSYECQDDRNAKIRREAIKIRSNVGTKISDIPAKTQLVGYVQDNSNTIIKKTTSPYNRDGKKSRQVTRQVDADEREEKLRELQDSNRVNEPPAKSWTKRIYSRMLESLEMLDVLENETNFSNTVYGERRMIASHADVDVRNVKSDDDRRERSRSRNRHKGKKISHDSTESDEEVDDLEMIEGSNETQNSYDSELSSLDGDYVETSKSREKSRNNSGKFIQDVNYPKIVGYRNNTHYKHHDFTKFSKHVDDLLNTKSLKASQCPSHDTPHSNKSSKKYPDSEQSQKKKNKDKYELVEDTSMLYQIPEDPISSKQFRSYIGAATSTIKQQIRHVLNQTDLMSPEIFQHKTTLGTSMTEEDKRSLTDKSDVEVSAKLIEADTDTTEMQDETMQRLVKLTEGLTSFINKNKAVKRSEKIAKMALRHSIVAQDLLFLKPLEVLLNFLCKAETPSLDVVQSLNTVAQNILQCELKDRDENKNPLLIDLEVQNKPHPKLEVLNKPQLESEIENNAQPGLEIQMKPQLDLEIENKSQPAVEIPVFKMEIQNKPQLELEVQNKLQLAVEVPVFGMEVQNKSQLESELQKKAQLDLEIENKSEPIVEVPVSNMGVKSDRQLAVKGFASNIEIKNKLPPVWKGPTLNIEVQNKLQPVGKAPVLDPPIKASSIRTSPIKPSNIIDQDLQYEVNDSLDIKKNEDVSRSECNKLSREIQLGSDVEKKVECEPSDMNDILYMTDNLSLLEVISKTQMPHNKVSPSDTTPIVSKSRVIQPVKPFRIKINARERNSRDAKPVEASRSKILAARDVVAEYRKQKQKNPIKPKMISSVEELQKPSQKINFPIKAKLINLDETNSAEQSEPDSKMEEMEKIDFPITIHLDEPISAEQSQPDSKREEMKKIDSPIEISSDRSISGEQSQPDSKGKEIQKIDSPITINLDKSISAEQSQPDSKRKEIQKIDSPITINLDKSISAEQSQPDSKRKEIQKIDSPITINLDKSISAEQSQPDSKKKEIPEIDSPISINLNKSISAEQSQPDLKKEETQKIEPVAKRPKIISFDQTTSLKQLEPSSKSNEKSNSVEVVESPHEMQTVTSVQELESDTIPVSDKPPEAPKTEKKEAKKSVSYVDEGLLAGATDQLPSAEQTEIASDDPNQQSEQDDATMMKKKKIHDMLQEMRTTGMEDQIYRNAMFVIKNKFQSNIPKASWKMQSTISSTSQEFAPKCKVWKVRYQTVGTVTSPNLLEKVSSIGPTKPTAEQIQQEYVINKALIALQKKTNKSPPKGHDKMKPIASSTSDAYALKKYKKCTDTTKEDLIEKVKELSKPASKRSKQ